jgi:hypothetical protein
MPDFERRALTEMERWVSDYESFVLDLNDGYDLCSAEYANDLAPRHFIEQNRGHPDIVGLRARIDAADSQLRQLLTPTKICFHGEYPATWFWYWGFPKNSPDLERDLVALGAI